MAAAADAGQSGDSYIGSFISLVSKAEIRYEGFLYHLSPQDSTIGLRNVKSFGTEGRRMDGPQLLPSDKVYEYIFFRGSDIKDLQVLSSPAPRSTVLPNDPAIIQPNSSSLIPTSSSFPAVNGVPQTNIGGNPQSGLPSPNYGGNRPQNQPAVSSGSWGSFPLPPIANGNGIALPTYWPGLNGPSLQASHLHYQSLLGTPQSLPVSHPVQHMMPNSTMNATLPVEASNIAESSFNSSTTLGLQSPSLTSTMSPQSAPPSSVCISRSSLLPVLSPNLVPTNTNDSLPAKTFGSKSLLVPPLIASSLDASPVVPPVVDKSISDFNPPLSNPTVCQPMQLINQSSGPVQSETPVPSLVTPSQLLQAKPARRSSPYLQTSHEDVAADRVSKQKPLSSDSVHAIDTALALPSFPVKKKKGTAQPNNPKVKVHARGSQNSKLHGAASMNHRTYTGRPRAREHELHGAAQMNHHAYRGYPRAREHELHGVDSMNHHAYRGCPRAREHEPNRASLHPNQTINGHHQGRKVGPNTADGRTHSNVRSHGRGKRSQPNSGDGHVHHNANSASGRTYYNANTASGHTTQHNAYTAGGRTTHHNANTAGGRTTHHYANTASGRTTHHNANTASGHTHYSVRRRGKGRGAQVSPPVTSFANDFDFDAMNEKFNKEEIWGDLGKSNQTQSNKDRGKGINYDANDTGVVNKFELPRYDPKPVYVKDDFFDSLSCHSLGAKLRRERAKLSELRKIDVETFGEIPKHSRGPSSGGRQSGGGSRRRRGYGYVGRGRGLDDGGRVT